ncbi:MAG: carboxymuconolactone decarboxylase family protein, partial [Polyangiales bacterium]
MHRIFGLAVRAQHSMGDGAQTIAMLLEFGRNSGISHGRSHSAIEIRLRGMQARMKNPALLFPDAMQALLALDKVTHRDGLPEVTRILVHLRASQINGCSVCVDMHWRGLKRSGETDERAFAVAAWRDAPYFTEAER